MEALSNLAILDYGSRRTGDKTLWWWDLGVDLEVGSRRRPARTARHTDDLVQDRKPLRVYAIDDGVGITDPRQHSNTTDEAEIMNLILGARQVVA